MKKAFSFLLSLCFMLAMPFVLTSCGGHNFSNDWKYNEDNHWHACLDEGCEEVSDKSSHNWVAESQTNEKIFYRCSTCSATKTHTHESSTNWSKDETNHWKSCTDSGCQKRFEENKHNWGTSVVDGFKTITTCSTCGYENVEVEEHTHSTGDNWEKDQANHWKVCTDSRCEEIIELNSHTWGEPVVEESIQTTTCEVCGYSRVEPYIPGHTHEYGDWSKDDNKHWKACIGTGAECDSIIEEGLHDWREESSESGVTYTCTVCGTVKGHTHTYSGSWQKNETHHWKACDEFGCEVKGEQATHDWGDGVTSGDTVTYTCSVCGGVKEHTHSFTNVWVYDETHHWKVCEKDCNETTQKTTHTWDKGIVEGDKKIYNCTSCRATKEEEYIAPQVPVQDYVLKLTNFEIETESFNYKVKVGELYYEITEEGKFVGYGVCSLVDSYA